MQGNEEAQGIQTHNVPALQLPKKLRGLRGIQKRTRRRIKGYGERTRSIKRRINAVIV